MAARFTTLLSPHLQPWWRAFFALLILIVSWLAFSRSPGPDAVQHLDKARHLLAFSVLAVVAAMAWRLPHALAPPIPLGLLGYGVLIEVVQTRIPGRDGSVADVVADALGIALGLALARWLRRSA